MSGSRSGKWTKFQESCGKLPMTCYHYRRTPKKPYRRVVDFIPKKVPRFQTTSYSLKHVKTSSRSPKLHQALRTHCSDLLNRATIRPEESQDLTPSQGQRSHDESIPVFSINVKPGKKNVLGQKYRVPQKNRFG